MEINKFQYVVGYKVILWDGRVFEKDEFIFFANDPDNYLAKFKRNILALGGIKDVVFTDWINNKRKMKLI